MKLQHNKQDKQDKQVDQIDFDFTGSFRVINVIENIALVSVNLCGKRGSLF